MLMLCACYMLYFLGCANVYVKLVYYTLRMYRQCSPFDDITVCCFFIVTFPLIVLNDVSALFSSHLVCFHFTKLLRF